MIFDKRLIILTSEKGLSVFDDFISYNLLNYELIIEPERGLHPKQHIERIKHIIKEVKNKKIILFTNSDYMLKMINICLVLNKTFDSKEEIIQKHNLNNLIISVDDVASYEYYNDKITECVFNVNDGYAYNSFDDIINCINELSDEIYYSICL